MSKWKKLKLSELGDVVGGATPSTKREDYYNGDISWLTPKDLSGYNARYIARGERSITQEGLESCSAKILPKNSVLFTSRAPIGYTVIAQNEVCTNQGFKSIVPNMNTDPLFLYYLLKYNKERIEAMGSGTTFKEVSGAVMKNVEVEVPEYEEQKQISSILSSIDDLIELNNQMNKNLEAQAQAIFKSWFVDFEPWGGVMPDHWREGALDECMELLDNKRIPLSGNERDKMQKIYPYYGAAALLDYVDDYLFDGIYLLFSEDGANVVDDDGHPLLQYVWGKFWVNNHAHILNGKNGFSVEMLYTMLKTTNARSAVTGAVQPKINQTNLRNIKAIIPIKEVLKKYDEIIQPLFKSLRKNKEEVQILATLRDTLLPKLMSGEIDVKEVNR